MARASLRASPSLLFSNAQAAFHLLCYASVSEAHVIDESAIHVAATESASAAATSASAAAASASPSPPPPVPSQQCAAKDGHAVLTAALLPASAGVIASATGGGTKGSIILAIAGTGGVQVFDAACSRQLAYIPVQTVVGLSTPASAPTPLSSSPTTTPTAAAAPPAPSQEVSAFCRGLASTASGDTIFVGTSAGDIAQLTATPTGSYSFSHPSLRLHTAAITCLTTTARYLASADEAGTVAVWDITSATKSKIADFANASLAPCAGVGVAGDVLVAAYTSGHVRIFRVHTRSLAVEICAHARAINALTIDPLRCLFATGADDGYVNVWALPNFESKESNMADLVSSVCIRDTLVTGVAFLATGDLIALGYDNNSIRFVPMVA